MKKILLPLIVLLLLVSSACKKVPSVTSGSNWKSAWLFPAVKGKLSLADLDKLRNNHVSHLVPPLSLGQPTGTPTNVPPLHITHVGPFAQEISPWVYKIHVDSLGIDLKLTNFFPIAIGAGTQITFRNDADTLNPANIFYTTTIPNDIQPNESFTISIKIENKVIEDTVFIYLDQFVSPGGNNVTFSTNPTLLDVTLKVLVLNSIELRTNQNFSSIDTIGVSVGGSSSGNNTGSSTFTDTSALGKIHIWLDNQMPVNTAMQIYFLNDTKTQIIDSLFNSRLVVNGANTDATGSPLNTQSSDVEISVTVNKINHIKSSKYAISDFNFNTQGYPPPKVVANRSAILKIQVTGDLEINLLF